MKSKFLFFITILSFFLILGASQASALILVVDSDPNPGGMFDIDVDGELNDYPWKKPNWDGLDHNWQYITPNAEGVEKEWLTALLGGTDPGAYSRDDDDTDGWTVPITWQYAVLKFGNSGGDPDHLAIYYEVGIDFSDTSIYPVYVTQGLSHITFFSGTLDPPYTPVPEPATMLLVGAGFVGIAGLKRRFRKR